MAFVKLNNSATFGWLLSSSILFRSSRRWCGSKRFEVQSVSQDSHRSRIPSLRHRRNVPDGTGALRGHQGIRHSSLYHKHMVAKSFQQSLKNLGMDYVDLYLMHAPQIEVPSECGWHVEDWTGRHSMSLMYAEMEKLLATGKVRAIGVSNFSIKTS
ncbi:hypothetical protein BDZ89DRAFT_236590 [Hymenopellis radicata]|nr:hypothetical protein BDZ89DRAFT_236590 [Hymenopellis radicata]